MQARGSRWAKMAAGFLTGVLVGFAGLAFSAGTIRAARLQDVARPAELPPQKVETPQELPPPPADLPATKVAVPLPEAKVEIAAPAREAVDPEKDAEEFVTRTRKEALDRIAALDREATELRARLAKVEAASARLKTAFGGFEPMIRPGAVHRDLGAPKVIDSTPRILQAPEPELQPAGQPKAES